MNVKLVGEDLQKTLCATGAAGTENDHVFE